MNSANQGIARARPVSSARRKISMEMGLQHSRTHILKCPPEYTRTRSEPNLHRLAPDLSATAVSAHHGPSDFDGALVQHTAGGSDPILASNVLQPVTTQLPSPLSPVFSALSTAPLQPQPLGGTTTTSPTTTSTPASPTTTSDTNEDNGNEVTDKYAALANLDAAFSDPTNMPATNVDWSIGGAQSSDDEPDAETSGRDGTQSRNSGVTSPEHHRHGAGAGINWNGTAGSDVPTPTPSTITTPTAPTVDDNEAVDKYAALVDLATDPAMSVDWGRPQSDDHESTADGAGPNSTISPNPPSGSSAGVTSPSSPSSGPQTATVPVMLASGAPPAPVLADTSGYYNPATQYGPPANGQASFGPPANGQPSFGPPANGQPSFGPPANGQPSFGPPANGQPSFGPPVSGQPCFGPPANGQPNYGLPANGQPSFGLPANGQPSFGLPANGQPNYGLSTNGQPGYGLSATGQPGFGPTPFGNNVMYGYQQIPTHKTSCPSTFSPVGFEGFSAHMDVGSQRFSAQMETGVPHITSASSSSSNPFAVSSPWSGHSSVCQS